MDPLHIVIAMGPLALYLMVLAFFNLQRRGIVLSGGQDLALLGAGLSGLALAGPIELFWPEAAAARFGAWVWLLLGVLYALAVTLAVLGFRPRIVVYNATRETLLPLLGRVADELDREARWAGSALLLPNLGLQLHLEPFAALRNVQLVASGPGQNFGSWAKLRAALRKAVEQSVQSPNPYGAVLLGFAAALATIIGYQIAARPDEVTQAWRLLQGLTAPPEVENREGNG